MADAARYRAFISYHHGTDRRLAAALATALTRFARPWWALRAMRVFLDQTSLAANPELWPTLERALGQAEWFVLLANPASAASPWVRQELRWWLANRSTRRMLIVHTGGSIAWRGGRFDAERTEALPPELHGAFDDEPLWVDFTGHAGWKRLSTRDDDFREPFLTLAAPLHDRSRDDLWSEHLRRWRQAFAAVGVALAMVAGALLGVRRVDQIASERDEQIDALKLGARALQVQRDDAVLAARIALAGVARRPSGVAAAALRAAVAELAGDARPGRVAEVADALDLAVSPDGRRVAVLARGGAVTLLDAAGEGRSVLPAAPGPLDARAIAWGADGTIAVAAGDGAWLWSGNGAPRRIEAPPVRSLAFGPDGTRLALGHDDGRWRVLATADGAPCAQGRAAGPVDAIALSTDGRQVATGGEVVQLWRLVDGRQDGRWPAAGGVRSLDFNRDGDGPFSEWMLAVAPAGAALRVIDPAEPARGIDLPPAATLARFVASGRCLVAARGDGPVDVLSAFGWGRLFRLAGEGGEVRALALGATGRFAVLRDAGRVAVFEQPLCGDAEAVCRFAAPLLREPMSAADRLRHLGAPAKEPPSQPPGKACQALIDRVLPGWR